MIAPSARSPVVECAALTKVFQDFWGRGRVRAVDDLELSILPGEVFGLLGPNGSGKTTTIKMLLGLLYPTRGYARVFDRPPTDTRVKAHIGFMPEESYLYRFLNAHETLDYYGRLFRLDRRERRRRTEQLIQMVGLRGAARRAVGEYSKGMARRIGLAQALINDPDLLILDEPTTGLDPIGARQIKDLIRELARRGKTVLLCSHLLADVEDVCDRVAIMYGGRRQALGRVRDLLSRQDVTQIRATQLDERTVARLRAIIESEAGRRVLAVEHPTQRLEDLFLSIVEQAERDRLATSGVEAARGVSEFLSAGPPGGGAELLETLVAAGQDDVSAAARPEEAVETRPTPVPRFEVLEQLTTEEHAAAFAAPEDRPSGPADETETEDAGGPRPIRLPPGPAPRRDVLERLTQPDEQQSEPQA